MVYLEQVFFANFLANLLLLFVCGRLCQRSASWKRYCLSSALLAVAGCLPLLLPMAGFRPVYGAVSIAAAAALGWRWVNCRLWLKLCCALLGCTCIAGGIAFAAASYTQNIPAFPLAPYVTALLAIFLCAALTFAVFARLRMRSAAQICRLRICVGQYTVVIDALVDTGNHLCEPVSGLPVVLLGQHYRYLLNTCPVRSVYTATAAGMRPLPCTAAKSAAINCGYGWQSIVPPCIAISENKSFAGHDALLPAYILC